MDLAICRYWNPNRACNLCQSTVRDGMAWRRGQVIWSLWNLYAGERKGSPWSLREVPTPFSRRVIRLIEFGVGIRPEAKAGQRGIDQEYDLEGVVELAIGLDLMDFSWPQTEVADYLIHERQTIRAAIKSKSDRLLLWIKPRPLRYRAYNELMESKLLFAEPIFTSNVERDGRILRDLDALNRGYLVLELGGTVKALDHFLSVAPEMRRGRR